MAALLGYGVLSLYEFLAFDWWQKDLARGLLGDEFPFSPRVILAGVLFAVLGLGIYLVVNHTKVVDFLIDTEAELHKVSWAPKHEVVSSSIVVIVTTIVIGVYLFFVDYLLNGLRTWVPWDSFWNTVFGG
ncbi:MAG: preprotein translocase subunit SecE [Planctomycetota bacterium]